MNLLEERTVHRISIYRKVRYSGSLGGELAINGKPICKTLELPWRWNAKGASCIPAGTFSGFWRQERMRVQLDNISVPGGSRVAIQIHAGNKPKHSRGCILVGRTIAENFVGHSRAAMRDIEAALFPGEYGPGYPRIRIELTVGGVLMHGFYDDIDILDRIAVTA